MTVFEFGTGFLVFITDVEKKPNRILRFHSEDQSSDVNFGIIKSTCDIIFRIYL